MERRTNENEETREFDHTDFYQMYQDEMDCICLLYTSRCV